MNRFATVPARILIVIGAWLLLCGSGNVTYELALAANRPPCEGQEDPAVRCRGTQGTRSVFNIRAGATLWFAQSDPAPAAFLFVGPLAVEPFAYPTPALGITVHETAGTLVMDVVYGLQRVEQTIEPDRWAQVHVPPHASFWVRIRPLS